MGWADPNKWAGFSPTKKGWAELGPDWVGSISAQQTIMLLLVWAGPGPDLKAGPEPVWPRREKRNGEGNEFSPPVLLHA